MIERMDLVGAWRRQLFGAGMVAAVVPLAIVAALVVVVAGAGGLGGLGSLGQIISGPQISSAREAAERSAAREPRDLALVAPAANAGAPAGTAGPAAPQAAPPLTEGTAPPPPARVVTPREPAGVRPVAPPPLAVPAPQPPAPPAAQPQPKNLATALESTVDKTVVLLEDVVDNLGKTVDGLLGGPSR